MDRSWGTGFIILFITLIAGTCLGATYRSYDDLNAAAIIISDHTSATFERARSIAEGTGARGLQMYPPDAIFGYFPTRPEQSLFAGLSVQLVFSRDDLAGKGLDGVVEKVLGDLFNQKNILMSAPPVNEGPFNDKVLRVPGDIIRATTPSGPRLGSPMELTDRGIQQNSEFLIGSVAVNVIFPESQGHDEDWTDQEIADAVSALSLGVSQYMQQALWVDLSFTYNFKNFKRVPVSMEPIESSMATDPIWMGEALAYLGYHDGAYVGAHELNTHVRDSLKTDWVFTVFVADMSNHYNPNAPSPDPGCWGGAGYVAYSYLGGPYLLVPYPACRYGYGLGFGRVFIHEMSHTFWALDEYASAGTLCTEESGYLAVATRNTLYKSCQETAPCIMQTASPPFSEPLPICEYTMGQVGLRDDNSNSIPDIYEVSPVVTFMTTPGVQLDTLLPGEEYLLSVTVTNGAVPNNNPQEDTTYMTRISYAPYIKSGEMSLNGQPFVAILPSGSKWDSPNEQIVMLMSATDFLPGSNPITIRVKNRVELSGQATKNVYVIGLKYYHVSMAVRDTSIQIAWTTAEEVFGAVFDVVRTDLTARGSAVSIGSVSVPDGIGDRRAYSFVDTHVTAGHEYRYRIVGRFSITFHGEHHSYEFPSQDIDETALVPIKAGFISNLLPNPTPDHTTFTVNVPRSYRDMSGSLARDAVRLAPSDIEVRTRVDINVYNSLGQRIKNIYSNSRFGGIMTLTWDGTDSNGRTVPTGVYFLRVDAGGKKDVKKVVILR